MNIMNVKKKPIENTNEKQNRRQVFFTTYAVKLTDKSKAFFHLNRTPTFQYKQLE